MSNIKNYEPLWGAWKIESLIGEGSFGKVYKVFRQDFDKIYYSAVKIISIPQNKSERHRLEGLGMDETSVRGFFQGLIGDIVYEIDLMNVFKGNSNIVSFDDYMIMESHETGWDILMRMELLKSLTSRIKENALSIPEVLTLGIHICRALELCAQKNIIHRDIKPANIFISEFGEYKLGDFGIARKIESTLSGLSKKGTYGYMAPEVFRGEEYGAGVDIYSLGMVLYVLLNRNRAPFLPDFPQPILPVHLDEALHRRMGGEAIPEIRQAGSNLNTVIRKACAYSRNDRYENPTQMRKALESLAENKGYPGEAMNNIGLPKHDANDATVHIAPTAMADQLNSLQTIDKVAEEKKGRGKPRCLINVVGSIRQREGSKQKNPTKKTGRAPLFIVIGGIAIIGIIIGGVYVMNSMRFSKTLAEPASPTLIFVPETDEVLPLPDSELVSNPDHNQSEYQQSTRGTEALIPVKTTDYNYSLCVKRQIKQTPNDSIKAA
ncbi:MAG: serine/threonine protein kinase [Peptococcaceae bacterium]|nr:serine/threonine protein kinase [Peptococcaceae bacterium]